MRLAIDTARVMRKSWADTTAEENASIKSGAGLTVAEKKEVQALAAFTEARTGQISESGVSLTQMREDLKDTQEAWTEDTKLLQDIGRDLVETYLEMCAKAVSRC